MLFSFCIETIVQEIFCAKERSFNTSYFESIKEKFIGAISEVYGHPKDLIDAQQKDGSKDIIILTFDVLNRSMNDSLLDMMKDRFKLIGNLNRVIKSVPELDSQSVIGASKPKHSKETDKPDRPKIYPSRNFPLNGTF